MVRPTLTQPDPAVRTRSDASSTRELAITTFTDGAPRNRLIRARHLCFLATAERGACARASSSSKSDQPSVSCWCTPTTWYWLAEAHAEQAKSCRMRTPPSKCLSRQHTQGTDRKWSVFWFYWPTDPTDEAACILLFPTGGSEPPGFGCPCTQDFACPGAVSGCTSLRL